MFKKILPFFLLVCLVCYLTITIYKSTHQNREVKNVLRPADIAQKYSPAPTSIPIPLASPKPLTFEEMNSLYGPCTHLPVIFYHHIQNMDVAKAAGQENLTVATVNFIAQMQYLKDKGYITLTSSSITDFFDKSIPVPQNAVIIVIDDGYEDFYVNALPILRQFGFKSMLALPTGLVGNPGYLTWGEVQEAAGSGVEVVNHTWSHADLASNDKNFVKMEIMTADQQLTNYGQNLNKVLVYPYGYSNSYDQSFLKDVGYTMAFTTKPGSTLCAKLRYTLPRIRIGNANLQAYGF